MKTIAMGRQTSAPRGRFRIVLGVALLALAACKGKTPKERIAEADGLFKQGNLLGAEIHYKDFLKKLPDDPAAQLVRFRLSTIYYREQDYEKCREVLSEIIRRAGGADNQVGLSAVTLKLQAYAQESRTPEALSEALATTPTLKTIDLAIHQDFLINTGSLLAQSKRFDEAKAIWLGIVQSPKAKDYNQIKAMFLTLAATYEQEKLDEGIKVCDDFLAAHPDFSRRTEILGQVGQFLLRVKRGDEANRYFARAEEDVRKKLDKTLGAESKCDALFQLAGLLESQRKADDARKVYESIIADFPLLEGQRSMAMLMLADNHEKAGRRPEAIAALETLIKTYPNTVGAQEAFKRREKLRVPVADGATSGTLTTQPPPAAPAAEKATPAPKEKGAEPAPAKGMEATPRADPKGGPSMGPKTGNKPPKAAKH